MNTLPSRPLCIVLSSPSGGGKTTLCSLLLAEFPATVYSVSCTTRPPRRGETEGRHYFFLAEPEFRRRIGEGFFLEYARVHGHWYGTPRRRIEQALLAGRDALLAIDVQGAERIRASIAAPAADRTANLLQKAFVDIFIAPPSVETLRQRLQARGQDEPGVIRRRLLNAEREMACRDRYSHVIINDRLEDAYARLKAIILAERARPPCPGRAN